MVQSIDQQLHQYIDILNASQKKSLLDIIKSFLQTGDSGESNERVSIEHYNKEIDESLGEFENGNFMLHEDVVALSNKWNKRGE